LLELSEQPVSTREIDRYQFEWSVRSGSKRVVLQKAEKLRKEGRMIGGQRMEKLLSEKINDVVPGL
jgi:hypothetical protein